MVCVTMFVCVLGERIDNQGVEEAAERNERLLTSCFSRRAGAAYTHPQPHIPHPHPIHTHPRRIHIQVGYGVTVHHNISLYIT